MGRQITLRGSAVPLYSMKYFNITSAEIKKWAVYDANTDSYPIAMPEMFGKESSKPVPEVTGYNENEDGTITLYVDALFVEYGTDKAFSHALDFWEPLPSSGRA